MRNTPPPPLLKQELRAFRFLNQNARRSCLRRRRESRQTCVLLLCVTRCQPHPVGLHTSKLEHKARLRHSARGRGWCDKLVQGPGRGVQLWSAMAEGSNSLPTFIFVFFAGVMRKKFMIKITLYYHPQFILERFRVTTHMSVYRENIRNVMNNTT